MKRQFKFLILILLPLILWSQNSERNLNSENWSFKKISDSYWLPAKVHGTVHTDLYNNKIIPNPFFGNNEKDLQWIENETWEYQTSFKISKEELKNQNTILQFEGLDTYAEIFLNNEKILDANNMFRTWKVDVKNNLKVGKNNLKIVFKSAVEIGKSKAQKLPYTLPEKERIFSRKAQYHFGWDWGPRFVTSGIYRPIKLLFWNNATIENVKYEQEELNEVIAKLNFKVTANCQFAGNYDLKINGFQKAFELKKGINSIDFPYEIKNPKLWWTNGLGNANLYPFEISLSKNKVQLSLKKLNIGLRTIELIQEKDGIGKSFYFKLNGKPVFMKGANYIPPDSFLPSATNSTYKEIVKNAVDANMNMLRVWGGGVYAEDTFYDECDKNGILVWQDFMFACAMYPGDEEFLDNVKNEVIDNVTRLQNHPSIALWCGNNENDEGWKNWGWQKQFKYSKQDSTQIWNDYEKLFHQLIPKTLDSLLSKKENRYWPSSPSIGWGKKESLTQGDSHYWGVWWGKEPFEIYKQKVGRFMSEYGFQGMPNLETLEKVIRKEDLNFTSEAFKNHQKHPTGFETINEYMARDFPIPKSLEKYNYVSQILQAYGMKTAIEAHRLTKPYCMGSLYWQLNDCWPVTSWSTLDYYGNWKASHYQVKESFAPTLLMVTEITNGLSIIGSNDNLEEQKGTLNAKLIDFSGKELWTASKECELNSEINTNCMDILFTELPKFAKEKTVLQLEFICKNKKTVAYHYFVKPKELQLEKPTIEMKIVGETLIELKTNTLVKDLYLQSNDSFFKENYFDLLPGIPKIIKTDKPSVNIKMVSLFDMLNE
ncbi:sugar-binding domain-containing protein [Flavobacterium sp.]|uniref:beta-mannosidase n=1 Tax=Flavobacterium sp. TaxID=239 RepID=UPI002606F038|nr:sugar-binding domain-containing protein [Flavobacterium sp.]